MEVGPRTAREEGEHLVAELRQRIAEYERYHGPFPAALREELIARQLAGPDNHPTPHPYGHGAKPTEDHRTRSNRSLIALGLVLYYGGHLVRKINESRGDARSGLSLGDRMVSQLEMGHALRLLRSSDGALATLLELLYHDNWGVLQVAQRLHIAPGTLRHRREMALNFLIVILFQDSGP